MSQKVLKVIMFVKPLLTRLKPYLRWVILGGTLFFIAKALKDNWREVTDLQITAQTWSLLTVSLGITLLAHLWSGWVWHWILALFNQPLGGLWSTQVYLKTNVAKYLPGNVWHFYGRVRALQTTGTPTGTAVLSVVMEPLLMAVAALILGCLVGGWQLSGSRWWIGQVVVLCIALVSVHPRIFNPVLQTLSRAKAKAQRLTFEGDRSPPLKAYPLRPLIGEIGFVALRASGFVFTVAALQPLTADAIQSLVAAFSLAWLLGLVIPGAPGGVGVFEATAISLLGGEFPAAVILSSVAFYRLISTLAEVIGAALAWLSEKMTDTAQSKQ
ncbi:lysylphosphatidylglycerol synthase domain-containing protein [soil metagenome]